MADTLKERLLGSVRVVRGSKEFAEGDFRWAESKSGEDRTNRSDKKMEVYINRQKFDDAGASNYEDKMILGESLHNLKNIDSDRYNRMENVALSDPDYLEWAQESYRRSVDEGERRPFHNWHRTSRFDQVIGGYLFAGDKDIPTMKNWNRDDLPWGEGLLKELKLLESDLSE